MARVLLLLLLAALPAAADPPPRWKLEYDAETPERFESGGVTCWGILFTLANKGPQPAPLAVGHEIRRDGAPVLSEVFLPDPVLEFLAARQGLAAGSRADRESALAALQEKGRWLTSAALTARREIAAGETLHGVAIVSEDGATRESLALVVRGLQDPVGFWPGDLDGLPLALRAVRLRIRFERQSGQFAPVRRDQFLALPQPAVRREDIAPLVSWLEDENPRVRRMALDLLCAGLNPAIPGNGQQVTGIEALLLRVEAEESLRAFLRYSRVVKRLAGESSQRRKELAAELRRRDPVGLKAVAGALEQQEDLKAEDLADLLFDALRHQGARCGNFAWKFLHELAVREEFDYDAESEAPADAETRKRRDAWKEWARRFAEQAVYDSKTGSWRAPDR